MGVDLGGKRKDDLPKDLLTSYSGAVKGINASSSLVDPSGVGNSSHRDQRAVAGGQWVNRRPLFVMKAINQTEFLGLRDSFRGRVHFHNETNSSFVDHFTTDKRFTTPPQIIIIVIRGTTGIKWRLASDQHLQIQRAGGTWIMVFVHLLLDIKCWGIFRNY